MVWYADNGITSRKYPLVRYSYQVHEITFLLNPSTIHSFDNNKMKICSFAICSSLSTAAAFAPTRFSQPAAATSTSTQQLNLSKDMNMADILRPFGTLAVAASLAFSPVSASAQDLHQYDTSSSIDSSITSSSMQVSETIKVLDMGLPSYGDISAPKSSTNAIKGTEAEKEKEGAKSTSVLPTKKAGSPMFPTGSAKEKKEKAPSAKAEKKQAAKAEKKQAAAAAPVEIKKEKEDKKDENVKFVDMSMPSYSDNASGPKKSAFAL
mmetsp:Transcript_3577/g.5465  ORF Transcript_3577/g.5465 Transcript_3577/m.5465 type:complete len:265 (+) Transcript_3577:2-796(+)